jgi:1-acyl-sn-glycerol-3-phosphate acyltransferase
VKRTVAGLVGGAIERLQQIDLIALWAAATARELEDQRFQRDEELLRRVLPLMERWGRYFDAEVRGFERVPPGGPMLLVGNHSGGVLVPDTPIFISRWYRERGLGRPLVGLAFDAAFGIPWFGSFMRRIGQVPANHTTAARALDLGHAVLVYPGGDHEAFRPWTDRNRIDLAGRTGFIELALRKGVPVVPVVSHGGHHTIVIVTRGERLGRLAAMRRLRTPTFPLALQIPWGLSVLSLPGIPLPAKITIEVGQPMPWTAYGPAAADDPAIVARCYEEITGAMQATLTRLAAETPYPVLARLRTLAGCGNDRRS